VSVAFIPKSLANQIANLPVLGVDACAYPPTAASTIGRKTNHWVLFLAISGTESPSPAKSSTNHLFSHDAVKNLPT